jgi:hypothetical protein
MKIEKVKLQLKLTTRINLLSSYIRQFSAVWDIKLMSDGRHFEYKDMIHSLEDKDIEEINRYIVNKTKKRILEDRKKLEGLL